MVWIFEEKSFRELGTEGCANFLTDDGAWTGAAHREYDAEHVEPVVECFPAMLVGWAARSGRRATAGRPPRGGRCRCPRKSAPAC